MAENKWITWFFSALQNIIMGPYLCLFFGESLRILPWDSSRKTTKNHHLWENTLDGTNPAPVDKPVYPIIYTGFFASKRWLFGISSMEISGCQPAFFPGNSLNKFKHL